MTDHAEVSGQIVRKLKRYLATSDSSTNTKSTGAVFQLVQGFVQERLDPASRPIHVRLLELDLGETVISASALLCRTFRVPKNILAWVLWYTQDFAKTFLAKKPPVLTAAFRVLQFTPDSPRPAPESPEELIANMNSMLRNLEHAIYLQVLNGGDSCNSSARAYQIASFGLTWLLILLHTAEREETVKFLQKVLPQPLFAGAACRNQCAGALADALRLLRVDVDALVQQSQPKGTLAWHAARAGKPEELEFWLLAGASPAAAVDDHNVLSACLCNEQPFAQRQQCLRVLQKYAKLASEDRTLKPPLTKAEVQLAMDQYVQWSGDSTPEDVESLYQEAQRLQSYGKTPRTNKPAATASSSREHTNFRWPSYPAEDDDELTNLTEHFADKTSLY